MRDLGANVAPDPNGAPDRRPIKVGEVWRIPLQGTLGDLERPWDNPASRVTGELTALVGARVMGEHRHPALVEQFTVLEGALAFLRFGGRGDSNPGLLVANEESLKLRRVATSVSFLKAVNCPTRPTPLHPV